MPIFRRNRLAAQNTHEEDPHSDSNQNNATTPVGYPYDKEIPSLFDRSPEDLAALFDAAVERERQINQMTRAERLATIVRSQELLKGLGVEIDPMATMIAANAFWTDRNMFDLEPEDYEDYYAGEPIPADIMPERMVD